MIWETARFTLCSGQARRGTKRAWAIRLRDPAKGWQWDTAAGVTRLFGTAATASLAMQKLEKDTPLSATFVAEYVAASWHAGGWRLVHKIVVSDTAEAQRPAP